MKDKTMDELVQEAKDRASADVYQRENGCIPTQCWSKEAEMREAWGKANTHIEWKELVVDAARKFVNCKGRYHSEQNMTALIELFKQEPMKP